MAHAGHAGRCKPGSGAADFCGAGLNALIARPILRCPGRDALPDGAHRHVETAHEAFAIEGTELFVNDAMDGHGSLGWCSKMVYQVIFFP